jgi:prepilin-type N-terminal cleavage/methylation domain-containing protein
MRRKNRTDRGFTLVETMCALAILGIALVGTMVALITTSQQLKDGQIRQYRSELVDAALQRFEVANKYPVNSGFFTGASPFAAATALTAACPGAVPCSQLAIGQWGAGYDLTQGLAPPPPPMVDLSIGAYFIVRTDGEIQQLTATTVPAVIGTPKCGDVTLPSGSYCREVMITSTTTAGAIVSSGAQWTGPWPPNPTITSQSIYTVWVRVSKTGDKLFQAAYATTSFAL